MKSQNKKLLIFWSLAIPFLVGWYFFWEHKNNKSETLESFSSILTLEKSLRDEIGNAFEIYKYISQEDNVERSYLLLFQNDMELRPSGGYLGSFGVLKIRNGKITSFEVHDTNAFDKRISAKIAPPQPMKKLLHINSWEMRDSNWYPDFPESAQKALEFYYLGKGEEKFAGIFGINTKVLSEVLEVTGPIKIEGFKQEFNSQNAVLEIEHEVEKAYIEKNLTFDERKFLLKKIGEEVKNKISAFGIKEKISLAQKMTTLLKEKEIQLYFENQNIQKIAQEAKWTGEIEKSWNQDFLHINLSNLGSFKSDLKMISEIDYTIDLTQKKPIATLKFRQIHTGKEKDWLTKNYQGYLKIYTPQKSWLLNLNELPQVKFEEKYNKKSFGIINKIPLGESREYKFVYTLPEEMKNQPYKLLIQKQSGMKNIPVKIMLKNANNQIQTKSIILQKDELIEF